MHDAVTGQQRPARLTRRFGMVMVVGSTVLAQTGCAVWRLPQAGRIAKAAQGFTQPPQAATRPLVVLGRGAGPWC